MAEKLENYDDIFLDMKKFPITLTKLPKGLLRPTEFRDADKQLRKEREAIDKQVLCYERTYQLMVDRQKYFGELYRADRSDKTHREQFEKLGRMRVRLRVSWDVARVEQLSIELKQQRLAELRAPLAEWVRENNRRLSKQKPPRDQFRLWTMKPADLEAYRKVHMPPILKRLDAQKVEEVHISQPVPETSVQMLEADGVEPETNIASDNIRTDQTNEDENAPPVKNDKTEDDNMVVPEKIVGAEIVLPDNMDTAENVFPDNMDTVENVLPDNMDTAENALKRMADRIDEENIYVHDSGIEEMNQHQHSDSLDSDAITEEIYKRLKAPKSEKRRAVNGFFDLDEMNVSSSYDDVFYQCHKPSTSSAVYLKPAHVLVPDNEHVAATTSSEGTDIANGNTPEKKFVPFFDDMPIFLNGRIVKLNSQYYRDESKDSENANMETE